MVLYIIGTSILAGASAVLLAFIQGVQIMKTIKQYTRCKGIC